MPFADDIEKFTEKSVQRAALVYKKIALDLFARIILKTPVDSGRLRGNWQAGVGVFVDGVLDVKDRSGNATIAAMTAVVQAAAPLATLTIVNNLPYARRIEYDSWSRQAPAGMVRVSVAEMASVVGDAVKVE